MADGPEPPTSATSDLAGKRFASDGDVQCAVDSWLKTHDTDFFHAGIDAEGQMLEHLWRLHKK